MRRLVNILQFGLHCWWLCPLWLLLWSMDKDWDSSTSEDWLSPPAYFFSFSLVKRRLDAPSRTPSGFLTGNFRGSLLRVTVVDPVYWTHCITFSPGPLWWPLWTARARWCRTGFGWVGEDWRTSSVSTTSRLSTTRRTTGYVRPQQSPHNTNFSPFYTFRRILLRY